MKVSWIVGEREPVGSVDPKTKQFQPRKGKNGGAVVQQKVTKIYAPKGR